MQRGNLDRQGKLLPLGQPLVLARGVVGCSGQSHVREKNSLDLCSTSPEFHV